MATTRPSITKYPKLKKLKLGRTTAQPEPRRRGRAHVLEEVGPDRVPAAELGAGRLRGDDARVGGGDAVVVELDPAAVEERVDVRVVVAAAAAADVHDDGVEQVRVPVIINSFGAGRCDGLLALRRLLDLLDRRGALEGRRRQPEGHAQRRAFLLYLVPHVVVGEALEVEHDY